MEAPEKSAMQTILDTEDTAEFTQRPLTQMHADQKPEEA
jgi:hypothetical protein